MRMGTTDKLSAVAESIQIGVPNSCAVAESMLGIASMLSGYILSPREEADKRATERWP